MRQATDECQERYRASELVVLYFAAENDRNGNPRRCFVLYHPLTGSLAAVDEGYSGVGALLDLPVKFRGDKKRICEALRHRVTGRIPVAPSYIRSTLREPTFGRKVEIRL